MDADIVHTLPHPQRRWSQAHKELLLSSVHPHSSGASHPWMQRVGAELPTWGQMKFCYPLWPPMREGPADLGSRE